MPDDNLDVNKDADTEAGESVDTSAADFTPSDDLIDTVDRIMQPSDDDSDPGKAENSQDSEDDAEKKAADDAAKEAEEEKAALEAKKDEELNDDELEKKHPHFKRRIDELRTKVSSTEERALKAEAQVEALKGVHAKPSTDGQDKDTGSSLAGIDFKDVMEMSEDDIQEQFADNPKGFLANFANQVAVETYQIVKATLDTERKKEQAAAQQKSVEATYSKYAQDNPDFTELWNSGKIKEFIDDHPGHNAISAHQMLTKDKSKSEVQKMIDDAVAKAKKETEEEVLKNVKAKRGASVISGGPAAGGKSHAIDAELKEPKKFGGIMTVLARRSLARRQKRAAQG